MSYVTNLELRDNLEMSGRGVAVRELKITVKIGMTERKL